VSQADEEARPVPDPAWVASVLDRLAATALVGDQPECVTHDEFRRLREYLAMDVLHRPRLTGAVAGMVGHQHPVTRTVIRPGDRFPVQIAKYVKHVLDDGEWDPDHTELHAYLGDLVRAVQDERSDVYLELDAGEWKVTFGHEGPADPESGETPYTVVSFLPEKGLWLTGFRPDRGRAYVSSRGAAQQGRWIRTHR